jgi:hypothetical protein
VIIKRLLGRAALMREAIRGNQLDVLGHLRKVGEPTEA